MAVARCSLSGTQLSTDEVKELLGVVNTWIWESVLSFSINVFKLNLRVRFSLRPHGVGPQFGTGRRSPLERTNKTNSSMTSKRRLEFTKFQLPSQRVRVDVNSRVQEI